MLHTFSGTLRSVTYKRAVTLRLIMHGTIRLTGYAQNPLHTFSRNLSVDREVVNLLRNCCGLATWKLV